MIGIPLGRHAPALDAVRALRTKCGRRDQGRFAVEGATLLAEALSAGCVPLAVYATPRGLEAVAGQAVPAERIFAIDERAMARLSDVETPPGVLAVFPKVLSNLDDLLSRGEPALVLAGIADPGNAGTLLRSAEIFGVRQAIFAREAVEPHNPKVVRATMGAIFRMALATADASDLVAAARERAYTLVAAARDGVALPDFIFPERTLVAVGNERHGVAAWLPHYDAGVAIPQTGRGESLNASVAGGIILYAFSQQFSGRTFDS